MSDFHIADKIKITCQSGLNSHHLRKKNDVHAAPNNTIVDFFLKSFKC
jgi:hypothetical protein